MKDTAGDNMYTRDFRTPEFLPGGGIPRSVDCFSARDVTSTISRRSEPNMNDAAMELRHVTNEAY